MRKQMNKRLCMLGFILLYVCSQVFLFPFMGAKVNAETEQGTVAVMNGPVRYGFNGGIQVFTAPTSGIYKLEAYGAQGGAEWGTGGAAGGYAMGYKKMKQGESVYICVASAASGTSAGYNGGGGGYFGEWGGGERTSGAGGGGCTSITTTNRGVLRNFASNTDEVLLVAGGGGGNFHGETWNGGKRDRYGTPGGSPKETAGFGQGTGGSGAGGGGYYGGAGGRYTAEGGSGGTNYVGLPAFTFAGQTYSGASKAGGQGGNGMCVISFVRYLVDASRQGEEEQHFIERQEVSMPFAFYGADYGVYLQVQTDLEQDGLSEDGWQEYDLSAVPDYLHVEVQEDEFHNGQVTFSLEASPDLNHSYYRILVKGLEENATSAYYHVSVDPLKLEYVYTDEEVLTVEAGTVLTAESYPVYVQYNHPDLHIQVGQDNEEGLAVIPFSDLKYLSTEEEDTITLSTVGEANPVTYHVCHPDLPTDAVRYFRVIDTTLPKFDGVDIKNPSFTNHVEPKTFELEVKAEDNSDGTLTYRIEDENGTVLAGPTSDPNFKIDVGENTKIIVVVIDESGNELRQEYDLVYVDETGPAIQTIRHNHTSWTKENVVITVEAGDGISGLAPEAYSYDEGRTWVKENTHSYGENGTFYVWVKDLVGNITKEKVEIHCIDKDAPSITEIICDPASNWTKGDAVLTVIASDAASGFPGEAYSFDGGKTWQSSNTKSFSEAGIVSLQVRDAVGNFAKMDVTLEKSSLMDQAANLLNGGKPTLRQGTIRSEGVDVLYGDENGKEAGNLVEHHPGAKGPVAGQIRVVKERGHWFQKLTTAQKVFVITSGTVITGGAIWLLLWMLHRACLVVQNLDGKKKHLGIFLLKKEGLEWVLDLSKLGYDSSFAGYECFLSEAFYRTQKKGYLTLKTLQRKDTKRIVKRNVCFYLNSL